jgi:(E)-4-hydroxy-3-methylbut-2-enyl-diphosphate synthase
MIPIAKEIEEYLNTINKPIHVAVMGCAVNGPGEAKEADLGIAGGTNEALLFKKGEIIRKIKSEDIISELKKEIDLL